MVRQSMVWIGFLCLFTLSVGLVSAQQAPQFVSSLTYRDRQISEDASIGEELFRITASHDPSPDVSVELRTSRPDVFDVIKSSTTVFVIKLKMILDSESEPSFQCSFTLIDSNLAFSSQTARFTVADVNDHAPEFTGMPYLSTVPENSAVGTAVFQLTATDRDRTYYFKRLEFSIESGNEEGVFSVDPANGLISLSKTVDFEAQSVYRLTVKATDNYGNEGTSPVRLHTEEYVVIHVADIADRPPYFSNLPCSVRLMENAPVGTELFTAVAYDGDIGIKNAISYRLLANDTDEPLGSPYLDIDTSSGAVTLKQRIDRETLQAPYGLVAFRVEAREIQSAGSVVSSSRSIESASVLIVDVNDNPPRFSHSGVRGSMAENSIQGTVIQLDTAVEVCDKDLAPNNRIVLETINDNDQPLRSVYTTPKETVGCATIVVYVNDSSQLTYKTTTSGRTASFKIRATDALSLVSTEMTVDVEVTNANHNRPQFLQHSYQAYIQENTRDIDPPFSVTAIDSDQPDTPNSRVTYSIESITPTSSFFHINSASGLLSLSSPPDAETSTQYNIKVKATDGGSPPMESTVTATVHVMDVNDVQPVITPSNWTIEVLETVLPGRVIGGIFATDADVTVPNNLVSYFISNDDSGSFTIDPASGLISLLKTLDREEEAQHSVSVTTSDKGSPSMSASVTLTIVVRDVNDEPPVFISDRKSVAVSESTQYGEVIGDMRAVDRDIGHLVVYSLDKLRMTCQNTVEEYTDCSPYRDWFAVDGSSGEISVSGALDRESVSVVILRVIATDTNTQRGSSTATGSVTITIEDSNDNRPEFAVTPREFLVYETLNRATPPIAFLTKVSARDKDLGENGKVTFTSTSDYFSVDETGVITAVKGFDRETTPWINFTIRATDGGQPSLSSATEFSVHVLDINDNPPDFVNFPTGPVVVEEERVYSSLVEISASDPDVMENAVVIYEIVSGNEEGAFKLDPVSGILQIIHGIDRDGPSGHTQFNLKVVACNRGRIQCSQERQLLVRVQDVNDNSPVFEERTLTASVREDTSMADSLAQVLATDADEGPNAQITYSCCEPGTGADLFTISPTTGKVTATSSLKDRLGLHWFIVTASDSGSVTKRVTRANVTIWVEDVNNHSPVIVHPVPSSGSIVSLSVPENITGEIVRIRAEDRDIGENAHLLYSIVTTNPSFSDHDYFNIESDTGRLLPGDRFHSHGGSALYKVQVDVEDSGVPPRSTLLSLHINVVDVNNIKPSFPVISKSINIVEGSTSCYSDVVPVAVDSDTDTPLQYFITSGSGAPLFTLTPQFRRLCPLRPLDRETSPQYTLMIRACDRQCDTIPNTDAFLSNDDTAETRWPSDYVKLIVTVGDVNDVTPSINSGLAITAAVVHGDMKGRVVTDLKDYLVDPDSVGVYTYELDKSSFVVPGDALSGSVQPAPFTVDSVSGIVTSAALFSRQSPQKIGFKVTVSDSVHTSSPTTVEVLILNPESLILLDVSRPIDDTKEKLAQYTSAVSEKVAGKVSVESIHSSANGFSTRLSLYVVDNENLLPWNGKRIQSEIYENEAITKSLQALYAQRPSEFAAPAASTDGEDDNPLAPLLVAVSIICVVVALTLIGLVIIGVQMRQRYKRHLKAAQLGGPNTFTPLDYSIGHHDMSVGSMDSRKANGRCKADKTPMLDKKFNEWGAENTGFDRISETSAHSLDDAMIDPLTLDEEITSDLGDTYNLRISLTTAATASSGESGEGSGVMGEDSTYEDMGGGVGAAAAAADQAATNMLKAILYNQRGRHPRPVNGQVPSLMSYSSSETRDPPVGCSMSSELRSESVGELGVGPIYPPKDFRNEDSLSESPYLLMRSSVLDSDLATTEV